MGSRELKKSFKKIRIFHKQLFKIKEKKGYPCVVLKNILNEHFMNFKLFFNEKKFKLLFIFKKRHFYFFKS